MQHETRIDAVRKSMAMPLKLESLSLSRSTLRPRLSCSSYVPKLQKAAPKVAPTGVTSVCCVGAAVAS